MTDSAALGLLYTTWPDAQSAADAAAVLLEEGLIACANILPAHQSVYRWKGEVCNEAEHAALFKTGPARVEALAARLAELHPYEEPCILALDVSRTGSAPGFLAWAEAETMTGV